MIAQEISGQRSTTADLQAGRILVGRLEDLQRNRKDFAVETTLATKKLEPRLKHLSESGYDTHLIFLWMPSDDLSVERVKARVRAGGHDIPEETIRRRFKSGLELFFTLYKDIVDSWRLYDNSRIADPRLIATGKRDTAPEVKQPDLFDQICKKWMP
jgi:predicted ABC-type ATPase